MPNLSVLDTPHESAPVPREQPDAPAGLPVSGQEATTLGLVELLLKEPALVNRLNRDPQAQRELLPRFLLIAETGFLVFGLAILILLEPRPPRPTRNVRA